MNEEQKNIVLDNQKLITYTIKKMNLMNIYDEVYDYALFGLIKGAMHFNPTFGSKVSTYLVASIKSNVLMGLRKKNALKRGKNIITLSLDKTYYRDKSGNDKTLLDVMPSNENIEKDLIYSYEMKNLYKIINSLNEKEKNVLKYTFGIYDTEVLDQKAIAKIIGVSQAQVSRIKIKALKKIKEKLEKEINI